jgi:hypothetical protein
MSNLTWSAPQGFDRHDIYANSISALGYTITEIKEEVYGEGSGMYTVVGFELTIGEQTHRFNVADHGDARGACVAAKQTAQAHHVNETTEATESTNNNDLTETDLTDAETTNTLIIMVRKSAVGGKFGDYVKLGLVRLDGTLTTEPSMISERARGVAEVIEVIEPVSRGAHFPHGACAASRAYAELTQRLDELTAR